MTIPTSPTIRGVGLSPAKIAIVAAAATADDLWKGYPIAGHPGDLLAKMLHEAGLTMSSCYRTTVLKHRAKYDRPDDLFTQNKAEASREGLTTVLYSTYIHPSLVEIRQQLIDELSLVQPTVIVALGDLAMWALTGTYGSVDTWRGSQLEPNFPTPWGEVTIIPTYDPAWVMKMWHVRSFAVRDLRRAHDVAERPAVYRWPAYKFEIRPSFHKVMGILHGLLELAETEGVDVPLACDIETIARQISCIGIAWNVRESMCIPFLTLDGNYWTEEEEEIAVMVLLRQLLTHPNARIIGQNFNYDNQHFAKHLGFLPNLTFDTMIAQHVLFPGIPKALDFLSSLYCHFHRYWKDEMDDYSRLPENMEQYWTYNCLSGDTPVLDAYCHWRPLKDIKIGDDLLTFTEEAEQRGTRKLVHAVVTNRASSYKEAVRVTFTDGTYLEGTAEHKVVARQPVPYRPGKHLLGTWEELGNLLPGYALSYVPKWERSFEYEDGWMAGLVDGEGTLGHHSQAGYKSICISIAQKEGVVAERFRRGLKRHGFDWNESEKVGAIYFGIRGGLSEQLRFLGIFETDRLQLNMLQIAMEQGFGGSQQLPKKIVKSVVAIGKIEVFDITTTAGTFLTSSGLAHNCKDCVTTFEVSLVLQELLSHLERWPQYDFMFEVSKSALTSMLRGMKINQEARSKVAGELLEAIAEYDVLIHQIVGFPLNVGSPKQMSDFFYNQLKCPIQKDRKTKRPTCSSPALQKIAEKEPLLKPLVDLIEKKRSLGVFLSTFCLMPLDTDGRMRCSFNVCGAETMRFSSSSNAFGTGGNLQNIPSGDEE